MAKDCLRKLAFSIGYSIDWLTGKVENVIKPGA